MDIPTAREYIKQREYIDEAVDKAINLYYLRLVELEERIDALEKKFEPIPNEEYFMESKPTKTIELTEIELEYLRMLLRDRKNYKEKVNLLNKLNGK